MGFSLNQYFIGSVKYSAQKLHIFLSSNGLANMLISSNNTNFSIYHFLYFFVCSCGFLWYHFIISIHYISIYYKLNDTIIYILLYTVTF